MTEKTVTEKSFSNKWRESTTLKLLVVPYSLVSGKYLFADITISETVADTVDVLYKIPPMSAGEFATSIAALLLIWLGREWTEKKK